jgi:twitching motility protein PilJ
MGLETDNDYQQRYGEAQIAYIQGDLEMANRIADEIEEAYPDNPSILLLKGHIYLRQQQFNLAQKKYLNLLEITDDQELIDIANQCLEQINEQKEFAEREEQNQDWTRNIKLDNLDWYTAELGDEDLEDPTLPQNKTFAHNSQNVSLSKSEEEQKDQVQEIKFEDTFTQDNGKPEQRNELDDDNAALRRQDQDENLFLSSDGIPDTHKEQIPVPSIFPPQEKDNNLNLNKGFNLDSQFSNNIGIEDEEISASNLKNMASEIPQGNLGKFLDLSLRTKQIVSASSVGIVTFMAVLMVSIFSGQIKSEGQEQSYSYPWGKRILLSLVAGATSGISTLGIGHLLANHLKRYTSDLQNQFQSMSQGNYNVQATVYSQDELGQVVASFNQMAKIINCTITEARKLAEQTEREREDLEHQVIRLLDDVEGAVRGDLTVQAKVTADVLGAVADAFNLTISNLKEIIEQVKKAAIQVNKSSTDSELFARNQSSGALKMAEEFGVTLNSVQMMTDSIQRVAEKAREAEEVARSSIVTALKGGDAVQRTVAGILQIRETVAETARKVKRLAEASQQISTIVAVISQISERTNLLALNASIQAARAGEAGRGFAIIADEVRQLADRSAKSLQEIEQIVLQIQTETGSVMSAMEEGIQQVKDVTKRSESAKHSLEDIIAVSNHIDALVRSITADTVEQRENSGAVAKVMQAVELTAQATSQESQRVASSLQNLVGIAKDLLSSVERFKIDPEEN